MDEKNKFKHEADAALKNILEPYRCVLCHRQVGINELYGAFGMCSQCLATEGFDEHHGG